MSTVRSLALYKSSQQPPASGSLLLEKGGYGAKDMITAVGVIRGDYICFRVFQCGTYATVGTYT